jgi:hypothetical protein
MATSEPLVPSPGLRSVLAILAALQTLDRPRARLYSAASHEVAGETLAYWKRTFGFALPCDVAVLEALRVPIFDRALGVLGDGDLPGAVDDDAWSLVWTGDPHGVHEAAEEPSYQQASELFVCLAKDPSSDGGEHAADPYVLVVDDEARRKLRLSAFLRQRLREHFEALEDDPGVSSAEAERRLQALGEAEAHPADAAVDGLFPARIVATAGAERAAVRVVHAKFGAGTIVGVGESGALVEFDSGETKRIKRDFLKDA